MQPRVGPGIAIGFALAQATASGQISITGTISSESPFTYSQSFDSLARTGTSNPWTDNTTLNGWYAQSVTSFGGYRADNGNDTTGDLYSYGANGGSDRALGSLPTGGVGDVAYGVRFRNNTSQSLTVTVSFTGEQWHESSAVAQFLAFAYKVSGSSITSPEAGTPGSPWTAVVGLNFTSPQTGTTTALDGNLAANRLFIVAPIPGLSLAAGQELFLRWYDADDGPSIADHGLAIDDVQVQFIPEGRGSSAIVAGALIAGMHWLNRRRRPVNRGVSDPPPVAALDTRRTVC